MVELYDIEEYQPQLRDYVDRLRTKYEVEEIYRDQQDDESYRKNQQNYAAHIQHVRWFDRWLKERDMDVEDITAQDGRKIGVDLKRKYAEATTASNRYLEINNIYEFLLQMGVLDDNPVEYWHDNKRDEFGFGRGNAQQDWYLDDEQEYAPTQEEVRLMEQNAPTPVTESQLIIRLSWQTGMRAGELRNLRIDDHLDRDNRLIHIPEEISKSEYDRFVPYQPSLDPLLRRWLDNGYRAKSKYKSGPYLLIGRSSEQISHHQINRAVKEAATNAGINETLWQDANGGERKKITHHNLRAGYATYISEETDCTLKRLSRLLGHSSIEVTERKYVEPKADSAVDAGRRFGPE